MSRIITERKFKMIFVERTLNLIKKDNITKNKLLIDLNLSKNSFVDWEKRDYFNVSTDYLLGRTDDIENNVTDSDWLYNFFVALPPLIRQRAKKWIIDRPQNTDIGTTFRRLKNYLCDSTDNSEISVEGLDNWFKDNDSNSFLNQFIFIENNLPLVLKFFGINIIDFIRNATLEFKYLTEDLTMADFERMHRYKKLDTTGKIKIESLLEQEEKRIAAANISSDIASTAQKDIAIRTNTAQK